MVLANLHALPDRRIIYRVLPGPDQLDNGADDRAALHDQHGAQHFLADDLIETLDALATGKFQVRAGLNRVDRTMWRRSGGGEGGAVSAEQAKSCQRQDHHEFVERMAHGRCTPCLYVRTSDPGIRPLPAV